MLEGGCHCRAVRYRITGETVYVALCHCSDCRRHSGAPVVTWAAVKREQLEIEGKLATDASSEHGQRQFCPACGTGLFYRNEKVLPGLVDIQAGTLDDPAALEPTIHVQTAERLDYITRLDALPAFERYPG